MTTLTSNPYAPPQAVVRDIAADTSALELADRGTRFAAAMIDGIVLAVLVYAPLILFSGVAAAAGEDGGGAGIVAFGLLFMVVGIGVWTWFTVRYVLRNGQSIAKKWLGIKVVRSDGSPISLGRIFWLRNVVNGLIGILPLYGLIDVLFIFSESRKCLHDKIADTIVIKA